MQKFWTQGCASEQEKKEIISKVHYADQDVLRILREKLQKDMESSYKDMMKRTQFADASWSYKQAGFIAEQRLLKTIIETYLQINENKA